MSQQYSVFHMLISTTFTLENAVCNHGYFMMPPNIWIPSTKTLQRPLRLSDSSFSVIVSISHSPNINYLLVRVHKQYLSYVDQQAIEEQVVRMLRITQKDKRDVNEFHKVHPQAKNKGFGRLFRSPTLFEDIIKSILLCNVGMYLSVVVVGNKISSPLESTSRVQQTHAHTNSIFVQFEAYMKRRMSILTTSRLFRRPIIVDHYHRYGFALPMSLAPMGWQRSLEMARALCELQSDLSDGVKRKEVGVKRKRATTIIGNFPSSKELATLTEEILRGRCNLGYRAKIILQVAKDVDTGKLKLNKLEEEEESCETVFTKLIKIKGFGDFVCSNVLMCIGFYQKVPIDTETTRHLREVHGREGRQRGDKEKHITELYEKFAPFQCLAYWFELWEYYESMYGKLSELPNSKYHTITGSRGGNISK